MKPSWLWSLSLALTLSTCGPEDEAVEASETEVAELVSVSKACPATRWVGEKPAGTACPTARVARGGRWQKTTVFTSAAASTANTVPPGMADFCSYEWVSTSTPPSPPVVSALPPLGRIPASAWLSRDCQIITPLAGAISDTATIWKELRDGFLKTTGSLSPLPKSGAVAAAAINPLPTRVAVVDSAVEGYVGGKAGVGKFAHGRAVGRAIRELSCPSDAVSATSPCIGHVANHLALSHVSPDVIDTTNGGYFGTQLELAQAIFRAVQAWRASIGTTGQQRLVINLSVGWEPVAAYGGDYVGTNVAALPGPARAVHAALTHASCQGALVIAAAGNRSGGTTPTQGAMYPAGWEKKRAPSPAECRAFEGWLFLNPANFPNFSRTPAYQPLVYAAGGVDGRDAELDSTREGGRPRLATYGYHVTSADGATHTAILTGSSMAAATASGIAATVWGYRPSLTAPQVMALVYGSGVSLDPAPGGAATKAEFCLGGGGCTEPIRRASLCQAVAAACSSQVERCPAVPPTCTTPAAYSGAEQPSWAGPDWSMAMDGVVHAEGELSSTATCASGNCAADTQIENKTAQPWVEPQPGWTGCDVCALSGGTLYLGLEPSFHWTSATLTVQTAAGPAVYDLTNTLGGMTVGANYQVSGFPIASASSASLSFGTTGASTSEQILTFP